MNLTERGQGSRGENFKTFLDFFKQGLKLHYVYGEKDSVLSRCQFNSDGCITSM